HVRGASSGSMAGAADADSDPRSQLRFRLRFASGTEIAQAHTGELGDELVPMPESGPVPALMDIGGESSWGAADGGGDARVRLWIWPLPAPGPTAGAGVGSGTMTLLCSWPQHGLSDAGLVLGVDAIRDAALRAQPFWPQRS
ncbi:MAG: hypothetical protein ACRDVE_18615, partial [Actinocrinis sp.]